MLFKKRRSPFLTLIVMGAYTWSVAKSRLFKHLLSDSLVQANRKPRINLCLFIHLMPIKIFFPENHYFLFCALICHLCPRWYIFHFSFFVVLSCPANAFQIFRTGRS